MEYKKLGDYCEVKGGKRLPKGEQLVEYETNHPYLRISDYSNGSVNLNNLKYVTEETFQKISRYIINEGDIFLSIVGTIGIVDFIDYKLDSASLTENAVRIRSFNESVLCTKFLSHFLKSNQGQNEMFIRTVGSTQPKLAITRIKDINIPIIDIKSQQKISNILSTIDEKITLNKNLIANLEELSQTLFKRWFVDFEFPDENDNPYKSSGGEMIDSELGKIPKDWKIKKLDDLLNLIIDHRGKTPKKLGSDWSEKGMPAISAKNIKNRKLVNVDKIKFINRETYVKWMKNEVEKGDIILTSEAPLGETYLINEDSKWVLSQRLYAMRTNESLNYIYFWEYVNSHYFQNELTKRSSGSTVTGIRQKELIQILVIVPPLKFQKKYFEILNPLVDDITRRNNEITMLTQLRDTLLPKLMSGEIEIPDDIEVNEDELSI